MDTVHFLHFHVPLSGKGSISGEDDAFAMSMAVPETTGPSSSAVADDWETGEAQQEEQLKSKQQQVRILKRAKDDRDAAKKATVDAANTAAAIQQTLPVPAEAKPIAPAPVKLLRRPNSGTNVATSSKGADDGETTEDGEHPHEEKQKKALEKRQADYDAARSRILGSDYKPEEVKAPANPSCRSRSPEIAMTTMRPPLIPSDHVVASPLIPLPPPEFIAAYHHQQMVMAGGTTYYTSPQPPPPLQSAFPPLSSSQSAGNLQSAASINTPHSSIPSLFSAVGGANVATSVQTGYRDFFDSTTPSLYATSSSQQPQPQPHAYHVAYGQPSTTSVMTSPPSGSALASLTTSVGKMSMGAAPTTMAPTTLDNKVSLLSAPLPYPPSLAASNGAMGQYALPPQYGRPPQPLLGNPEIVYRHVPSTTTNQQKSRKNYN